MTPLALTDDELRALAARVLLSNPDSPEVRRLAREALVKLIAALPTGSREVGRALLQSLVDRRAIVRPEPVADHIFLALLGALSRGRQVRVHYRDPSVNGDDTREPEVTRLHPHRLVRHDRGWLLVGRSTLHRKQWSIDLGRIEQVAELEEEAERPPARSPFAAPDGTAAQV
jgi:predicted DNA-binding transcriptional regulator YafY